MTTQLDLPFNNQIHHLPMLNEEWDEPIILEKLEANPGITHKQLLIALNRDRASPISADQLRRFIIQLEDQSKVGLCQIIRSPKKSAPDIFFGERINLEVKWLRAGGKAKGDHKYSWLCEGKKPIKYIGGGNEKSPTAKMRAELIEDWIKQGLSKAEIIALIPKLQTYLKKNPKKSQG